MSLGTTKITFTREETVEIDLDKLKEQLLDDGMDVDIDRIDAEELADYIQNDLSKYWTPDYIIDHSEDYDSEVDWGALWKVINAIEEEAKEEEE